MSAADPAEGKSSASVRRVIFFSGRVQGVGFRYTTERIACRYDVKGFVRNLSDGRVELVAEGTVNDLDGVQRAVEEAMHGYIDRTHAADTSPTGEFAAFRIVHS